MKNGRLEAWKVGVPILPFFLPSIPTDAVLFLFSFTPLTFISNQPSAISKEGFGNPNTSCN
jgi:hypothetical protein